MTDPGDPFEARARDLLRHTPLIDGHNDLAYALRKRVGPRTSQVDLERPQPDLDTDIPRCGPAGSAASSGRSASRRSSQPAATLQSLEQIDVVHRLIERYPDAFGRRRPPTRSRPSSRGPYRRRSSASRAAASIGSSMPTLRNAYARGVRYMTLTHRKRRPGPTPRPTRRATAGSPPSGRGRREMNRLGMLVDLSHVVARHDEPTRSTSPRRRSSSRIRCAAGDLRRTRATSRTTCSAGSRPTAGS